MRSRGASIVFVVLCSYLHADERSQKNGLQAQQIQLLEKMRYVMRVSKLSKRDPDMRKIAMLNSALMNTERELENVQQREAEEAPREQDELEALEKILSFGAVTFSPSQDQDIDTAESSDQFVSDEPHGTTKKPSRFKVVYSTLPKFSAKL